MNTTTAAPAAKTYDITYVNEAKGGVVVHLAGCKDLDKVGKGNHDEEAGTVTVTSQRDAFLEYNADFIAEGGEENAWDLQWKNCAKHVPFEDPTTETTNTNTTEENTMTENTATETTMTKKELAAALKDAGIKFPTRATKEELTALLDAHLDATHEEFAPAAEAEETKQAEMKARRAVETSRAPRRPEVRETAEGKRVNTKKNYTVKEVAELLNASPISVNRWVQMGKLTAVKSDPKEGRVVNLIPGSSVAEFLKGRADRAKASEKAKADKAAAAKAAADKRQAAKEAKAAKEKAKLDNAKAQAAKVTKKA